MIVFSNSLIELWRSLAELLLPYLYLTALFFTYGVLLLSAVRLRRSAGYRIMTAAKRAEKYFKANRAIYPDTSYLFYSKVIKPLPAALRQCFKGFSEGGFDGEKLGETARSAIPVTALSLRVYSICTSMVTILYLAFSIAGGYSLERMLFLMSFLLLNNLAGKLLLTFYVYSFEGRAVEAAARLCLLVKDRYIAPERKEKALSQELLELLD